jgi:hypothetical protein
MGMTKEIVRYSKALSEVDFMYTYETKRTDLGGQSGTTRCFTTSGSEHDYSHNDEKRGDKSAFPCIQC